MMVLKPQDSLDLSPVGEWKGVSWVIGEWMSELE
jgi:hypothetical protein